MDKEEITRESLATSIDNTIKDYLPNQRYTQYKLKGSEHVLKWVSSYDEDDQLFVLKMTDHILKMTYISKEQAIKMLGNYASGERLPQCSFLDIQSFVSRGESQTDMLDLLGGIAPITRSYTKGDHFVYLDDVSFTGNTARASLKHWIEHYAPQKATLEIVYLSSYSSGNYYTTNYLKSVIAGARKDITLSPIKSLDCEYENRLSECRYADVLWPTRELSTEYGGGAGKCRTGFSPTPLFDNNEDRKRYEHIMVDMGCSIRDCYHQPPAWFKPLGFSAFAGLGFGGLAITWRRCPNNVPVAFWWSQLTSDIDVFDCDAYPLFIRDKN